MELAKLCKTRLDSDGLRWTQMDSDDLVRLGWNQLDLNGLRWTRLESLFSSFLTRLNSSVPNSI